MFTSDISGIFSALEFLISLILSCSIRGKISFVNDRCFVRHEIVMPIISIDRFQKKILRIKMKIKIII